MKSPTERAIEVLGQIVFKASACTDPTCEACTLIQSWGYREFEQVGLAIVDAGELERLRDMLGQIAAWLEWTQERDVPPGDRLTLIALVRRALGDDAYNRASARESKAEGVK